MGYSENMAKGPKGEKRPADLNRRAFSIVQIAAGEVDDAPPADTTAQALGRKGGRARAAKISPERRAEIAKAAAKSRWQK